MLFTDNNNTSILDNESTNTDTITSSNEGFKETTNAISKNSSFKNKRPQTLSLGSAALNLRNDFTEKQNQTKPPTSSTFEAILESSKPSNHLNTSLTYTTVLEQYQDTPPNKNSNDTDIIYPGQESGELKDFENSTNNLINIPTPNSNIIFEGASSNKYETPSRTPSRQLSRASSVRFSKHAVIINCGEKDPLLSKNNSFSKKSILKDQLVTPPSISTDKIDIISKAPSGVSVTDTSILNNEKFLITSVEKNISKVSRQKSFNDLIEKFDGSDEFKDSDNLSVDSPSDKSIQESKEISDHKNKNLMIPITNPIDFDDSESEKESLKSNKSSLISMESSLKNNNNFSTANSKNSQVYVILMWISLTLFLATVAIAVPIIIIFMRGSESSTISYFEHASPKTRNKTIDIILTRFFNNYSLNSLNDKRKEKLQNKKIHDETPIKPNKKKTPQKTINDLDSVLKNIPKEYTNDTQVIQMMTRNDLKQSFYGINYTPKNVIHPSCGIITKNVILDLLMLSKVTTNIKTSGVQCGQLRIILDIIQRFHLNLKVSAGVLITKDHQFNLQQIKEIKYIIDHYSMSNINSIFIGNDVLYRKEQDEDVLIDYIKEVKTYIQLKNLDIPVGTAELGNYVTENIFKHSDIIGVNIYPFFTGQIVQTSTNWVYDFKKYQIDPLSSKYPGKQVVIGEIGWPYSGGNHKKSVAGQKHVQKFMSDFVCYSRNQTVGYYFFEAFDEPWKKIYYKNNNKWQTEWGLFTTDRNLKPGLSLPSC
ncbi:hypothetical protein ACO0SA_000931 [Hanseniaspora valbyensis]